MSSSRKDSRPARVSKLKAMGTVVAIKVCGSQTNARDNSRVEGKNLCDGPLVNPHTARILHAPVVVVPHGEHSIDSLGKVVRLVAHMVEQLRDLYGVLIPCAECGNLHHQVAPYLEEERAILANAETHVLARGPFRWHLPVLCKVAIQAVAQAAGLVVKPEVAGLGDGAKQSHVAPDACDSHGNLAVMIAVELADPCGIGGHCVHEEGACRGEAHQGRRVAHKANSGHDHVVCRVVRKDVGLRVQQAERGE